MKKYLVTVPYTVLVNVEVVAASEEEAKEFAVPLATLINYHSNGGTKKLIGPCAFPSALSYLIIHKLGRSLKGITILSR